MRCSALGGLDRRSPEEIIDCARGLVDRGGTVYRSASVKEHDESGEWNVRYGFGADPTAVASSLSITDRSETLSLSELRFRSTETARNSAFP